MTKDRDLGFSNNKYRINTKTSRANSMPQIMLKTVTLVLAKNADGAQPFLVSDDDIEMGDTVCELSASGTWLLATIDATDFVNGTTQKKVIATPDQIGYLVDHKKEVTELHSANRSMLARELSPKDITTILDSGGECAIEMETFEGACCGFRTVKYNDGKVLIHLKDSHSS